MRRSCEVMDLVCNWGGTLRLLCWRSPMLIGKHPNDLANVGVGVRLNKGSRKHEYPLWDHSPVRRTVE